MTSRRSTRNRAIAGAAFIAGLAGLAGSAFTASNTLPAASVVRGYGSQTITGVTAEQVNYGLNAPKDKVTSVGLVLTGDTTGQTIQIAFNDANPATCSGSGTYASGTDDTTYSCTVDEFVANTDKFALIAS
ncbi:MAG: hypothetical protein QOF60_2589 [Actinomycetota bacterium]|jgi:hypothetical protein|nr:hypothetical protein [Actinomycetota bacterium]